MSHVYFCIHFVVVKTGTGRYIRLHTGGCPRLPSKWNAVDRQCHLSRYVDYACNFTICFYDLT